MIPTPASKLDYYIKILDSALRKERRLGDIDRHNIQNAILQYKKDCPEHSLVLQGLIYAVDGDEAASIKCTKKAVEIAPHSIFAHMNLAYAGIRYGSEDIASPAARKVFDLCVEQNNWAALENLTAISSIINDSNLLHDIINVATKLKIKSYVIAAGAIMLSMDGESDEDCVNILENTFSDAILKESSIKINDNLWSEMEELADELEKYMD